MTNNNDLLNGKGSKQDRNPSKLDNNECAINVFQCMNVTSRLQHNGATQ
jgi:hypothetical protein